MPVAVLRGAWGHGLGVCGGDSLGQGTAELVGWFSSCHHHQVILPPPGTTVPGHQVQARREGILTAHVVKAAGL